MSYAKMTTMLIYIFLIISPYPYFFNSFSERNSANVRNILKILGRIKEQVSAKCCMQE